MLRELGQTDPGQTCMIYVDNKSAIAVAHNPMGSARTRHVDIKDCFVKEILSKGEISVYWLAGTENLGDLWTKSQSRAMFDTCMDKLYRRDGGNSMRNDLRQIRGNMKDVINGNHTFEACGPKCTCDNQGNELFGLIRNAMRDVVQKGAPTYQEYGNKRRKH